MAHTPAGFVFVTACLASLTLMCYAKSDDRLQSKCTTCKRIAESFNAKYKETDTIHFRGESKGWSLDNEKFLGRYKMGEARLAEIIERVCERSDAKCNELMEDLEGPLEEWWAVKDRNKQGGDIAGLESYLCMDTMKYCCPEGTYGPQCAACPTPKNGTVCNGRGVCNGNGWRGGSGKCKCDVGWSGKRCDKCKKGFFKMEANTTDGMSTEWECQRCDTACKNCTAAGPEGCVACAKGFVERLELTRTCVDIDECVTPSTEDPFCPDVHTFCRNEPGSAFCDPCHTTCKDPGVDGARWCAGPDPENCTVCPDGYETVEGEGGGCVDVDECANGVTCKANEFCYNLPGTHQCMRCDAKCSDKGCTGIGSAGCIECRDGYVRKATETDSTDADGTTSECVDVDECSDFVCADAATCINTDGGHECKCIEPSVEDPETGTCQRPAWLPAMRAVSDFTDDAVETARSQLRGNDAGANTLVKNVTVGSSDGNIKVIDVSFDSGVFADVPAVAYIRTTNECCGDAFGLKASNVTQHGFALVVWRTDTQSGWGQELEVEWGASGSSGKDQEDEGADRTEL